MPSRLPRHHLLVWNGPLCATAAGWLAKGWSGHGPLDLSDTLIVVPTRQAGRRLREALAAHAANREQAVFPPRVVVPEQVLDVAAAGPSPEVPSRADVLAAWATVFGAIDIADFPAVFPVPPDHRTFAWSLALAVEFTRLQDSLAEGGWRISDVVGQTDATFPERERWVQLARLEQACDHQLALRGRRPLIEIQRETARTPGVPPQPIRRVVLLAVPDLRPLVRQVLETWSGALEVVVAIWAGKEELDTFDAWGRPDARIWGRQPVSLERFREHVHLASEPRAQAEKVAAVAAAYRGREGDLALGSADPELMPVLAAALREQGLRPYLPEGEALARHRLAGLIGTLLAAVREDRWMPFSTLARHPDVLRWLRRTQSGFSTARWLAALDAVQARHLPAQVADVQRHWSVSRGDHPVTHSSCLEQVRRLVERVRDGAFPADWDQALGMIFSGESIDGAHPEEAAFIEAARAWSQVSAEVARAAGDWPALDACRLALQLFGQTRRFDEKPAQAVEVNGWLELLFEDAPHLLLAGVNEGAVPEAVIGHAFLPESLREKLGLKTNEQRLARDAWLLAALVESRRERGRLDLFVGQFAASGDPLRPSRLLFLCDEEELPDRVDWLFRELPPANGTVAWQRGWRLQVPELRPPSYLRVTAFRDYLRCPFRFFLKHSLKMEAVEPERQELDPRDFGDLVHRVLEKLGRNPDWRDCTDDRVLALEFTHELDRLVAVRYGQVLSLPLVVQVESARQRLSHAARVQAETRASGWVIQEVEWPFPADQLKQGVMPMRGTIDRIERHEETGEWRVLDYKTAEAAVDPVAAHLRGLRKEEEPRRPEFAIVDERGRARVWTDLQLPLYRWALQEVMGVDRAQLGYFNLPKAVGETRIQIWDTYDDRLHQQALVCAQAVAAAVAAAEFWPPVEEVRPDDFATLFHRGARESVQCMEVAIP